MKDQYADHMYQTGDLHPHIKNYFELQPKKKGKVQIFYIFALVEFNYLKFFKYHSIFFKGFEL